MSGAISKQTKDTLGAKQNSSILEQPFVVYHSKNSPLFPHWVALHKLLPLHVSNIFYFCPLHVGIKKKIFF